MGLFELPKGVHLWSTRTLIPGGDFSLLLFYNFYMEWESKTQNLKKIYCWDK